MKKFIAFTLAEVLASLVIIGVIAALTIPTVVTNAQSKIQTAGLKKAITTLNQIAEMSVIDSRFQPVPKCFYWDQNPYGKSKCVEWASYKTDPITGEKIPTGKCIKYALESGEPWPGDIVNGIFDHCGSFFNYIKDNLNVVKYCDKDGYKNGCLPDYNGNDTASKADNPDKSEDDIAKDLSGCAGWSKASLKTKSAMITSDGMIFFTYINNSARLLAVDVNGKSGPNKWGYDVFPLMPQGNNGNPPMFVPKGCQFIEKGGKLGHQRVLED